MALRTVTVTCGNQTVQTTVEVPNPVLTITPVEGTSDPYHYTVTVNGAFTGDTVYLEWGDGSRDAGRQPADPTQGVEFTHTYAVSGEKTLKASSMPSEGQGSKTIIVSEQTPTLKTSAVYLHGTDSVTHVDKTDTTVTFDFGDGTAPEVVPLVDHAASVQHEYADASGSPYTVKVTTDVTKVTYVEQVTVTPPVLATVVSADPKVVANLTGVDASDSTFDIDWGDGNVPDIAVPTTGATGTKDHTYAKNGTYTVGVTLKPSGQHLTAQAVVTKVAPPKLATPANAAVDGTPTDTAGGVKWDAVTDATSYTATANPGAIAGVVTGTKAAFTGLTADTEYTVSVVAKAAGHADSDAAKPKLKTAKAGG